MKIKATLVLVGLDGEKLDNNGKGDLTVGMAISNILSVTKSDNQVRSWYLAQEFYKKPEVTLKAEEVVFLKELIARNELYFPIVTGQLLQLIEE
jgi:hypothetical protein